ncbi:MAG: sulfotransferase [Candidatus Omnitrophica bacterium]|nr:sulfotransferase [Candidatus Omnitrophota bacterium]
MILVTGAHRSGTTFVGRMLTLSPRLIYIREPFNLYLHRGEAVRYWFPYVTKENSALFESFLRREHLSLYVQLKKEIKSPRKNPVPWAWFKKQCRSFLSGGGPVRLLVKDPIAVFSADWLAKKFKTRVVMMIRHPAAFIGSIKAQNWTHPFSHFLENQALMKDHLYPFKKEIIEFSREEKPVVDQAILLWRLIYFRVMKYQQEYPDWSYVRHEDLSRDPIGGFKILYDKFGLPWRPWIENKILEHTQATDFSKTDCEYNDLARHSESNIYNWKNRLTAEEIEKIRFKTRDLWPHFYSENDWANEELSVS